MTLIGVDVDGPYAPFVVRSNAVPCLIREYLIEGLGKRFAAGQRIVDADKNVEGYFFL